jgi:hypothetical protein
MARKIKLLCDVCDAGTDARLCLGCTAELEQALAELPADLTDLQAVATLQAAGPMGLGDPRRQWEGRPTADALDVMPWVFAPGASDLIWTAANTLTTWVRHLCESRGLEVPPVNGGYSSVRRFGIVRNRACWLTVRVFAPYASQPLGPIATWLLANLNAIRQDEAAAQIHDEITWLHQSMDAAIVGRAGLEEFYGRCESPDVRVRPARPVAAPIGPRCYGLTSCGHGSCDEIRDAETGHPLVTVLGRCNADLYAEPDADVIECRACGVGYTAAERKKAVREQGRDTIGTVSEVVAALTKLGRAVHVETVNSAIRRGRIQVRGLNGHSHRLVRVGDVEAYLDETAARVAERTAMRRSA